MFDASVRRNYVFVRASLATTPQALLSRLIWVLLVAGFPKFASGALTFHLAVRCIERPCGAILRTGTHSSFGYLQVIHVLILRVELWLP